MQIAFVGLGQMGGPMAERVAASDVDLAVFDVRPEAAERCVAAGARLAEGPVDAARNADVVCIVVATDAQVLDVVSDELIANTAPDAIVVLHATIGLDTVREVARRCEAHGRMALDVGISGGESGARGGTLALMVGGSAEALARVQPVLKAYGSDIFHAGDTGTGMAAKLARNLIGYGMMAAVHDGQVLAEAAGVPLRQFREILDATGDTLKMMTDFVAGRPSTAATPVETGRHDGARGLVEIGHKDLAMAYAAAIEVGVRVETAGTSQQLYGKTYGLDVPIDPALDIDQMD